MALSISKDDIGKDLILAYEEGDQKDYYLAKLTLVKTTNNTVDTGYFSVPVSGENFIIDNGDENYSYEVIS